MDWESCGVVGFDLGPLLQGCFSGGYKFAPVLRCVGLVKRPARDACLCMGDLQAQAAPPAPHFAKARREIMK